MQYCPFKSSGEDAQKKHQSSQQTATPGKKLMRRATKSIITLEHKGVLTVQVISASNLSVRLGFTLVAPYRTCKATKLTWHSFQIYSMSAGVYEMEHACQSVKWLLMQRQRALAGTLHVMLSVWRNTQLRQTVVAHQEPRRSHCPKSVCCSHVQAPDEKGDVDPYVELLLFDPATKETKKQQTSHLQNEPSPKWGEKFDFPMVSAPSILTGAPRCLCSPFSPLNIAG